MAPIRTFKRKMERKQPVMRFFKWFGLPVLLWMMFSMTAYAEKAELMEALPNIYCLVDKSGEGANSVFIITKEGVVVMDTRASEQEGKEVLAAIREKTEQPVAYVLNSHFHPENISGNSAFADTRTVIAHRKAQAAIIIDAREQKRKITPPNLSFRKKLDLMLGQYHLKLFHPGTAHTEGDLYIYIPKWRIILTGGLVYNQIIPFLGDATIEGWIEALREMERLDAEVIVPGHGPVAGKPVITQMKHYLMELKRFVNDALDDRKNLPDAMVLVKDKLKAKYEGWAHFDRVDENIVRAYLEYSDKRGH